MTANEDAAPREEVLDRLHDLLSEAPEHAHEREVRLRALVERDSSSPVVLVGAGNLGRKTLAVLRSHGRAVDAFIDNDRDRWGTSVDGVPVLAPDQGSREYSERGLAIVTIWRAEGGHDFLVTRDRLLELGWRAVESFIPLFWGYGEAALPHITIDRPSQVLAARDAVMAAASLWSDGRSLRDYVGQVEWRLHADFRALPKAEPNQYFADGLVSVGSDEVFVDCGAFTGDTLLDVAGRVSSWCEYHAFEPDPASFQRLSTAAATLPKRLAERVHLHPAGTADHRGKAAFNATGLASASLVSSGTAEIDLVTIDETVVEQPATFVKMDIEGAESAALAGAAHTITSVRPLLAIAAYHRQSDLWELPRQVFQLAPEYRLFLRPHADEGFDTVLYAVPPERLPG